MKSTIFLYSSTEETFQLRKRVLQFHRNSTKGPSSVFENLIGGLTRLKIPFSLVSSPNELLLAKSEDLMMIPTWNRPECELLDVLSNAATQQVILGPNIELSAGALQYLSLWPNRYCCVIVPNQNSRLEKLKRWPQIKWESWPTGIDSRYWSPAKFRGRRDKVLLYIKSLGTEISHRDAKLIHAVSENDSFSILRYGSYSPAQFRKTLRKSKVAIWFGVPESQGLALAESWSCGVPTWVRVPESCRDRPYNFSPYLSSTTGDFFVPEDIQSLDELIDISTAKWQKSPRAWILSNLTIENSVLELLQKTRI